MSDQETLYASARELTTDLLPRVRELIGEQSSPKVSGGGGGGGKKLSAPAPWNNAAAMTALGIGDDARRFESMLSLRLFQRVTYRPATDAQVDDCISRLPVLIAHAREVLTDDGDIAEVEAIAAAVAAWPRQCRAILDELRADEQPWTRAPGDLRCPDCMESLWLAPGWAQSPDSADVHCMRCVDADGQPLRWAPSVWTVLVSADDESPQDWLTPVEAAEVLDLTVNAARVRAHRKGWRKLGAGHHVRYAREDVLAQVA